ncbi:hypothetical protein AAHB53_22035 [Niallia circulans]
MLSEINGSQFITTNMMIQSDKKDDAKEELKKHSIRYQRVEAFSTTLPLIEKITEIDQETWKDKVNKVINELNGDLKK